MVNHLLATWNHTETRVTLTRSRFVTALGAGLALVRARSEAAAQCRKKSDRCDRSDQCCSNRCRRGFCYPRRR